MKKMITRTIKILAVHRLVNEIGQIQERMKEIEESRVRYGIQIRARATTAVGK